MAANNISTPQDVLGRMFYELREKRERTMRMHIYFYATKAFDNTVEALGGIEVLKEAMQNGHISISAGDSDVLEYIIQKIDNEEAKTALIS